jgi:hypothetical protein
MKPRISIVSLPVLYILAAGLAALAWAVEPARSRPPASEPVAVSVTEFQQAMPIGYLGLPLGTVVRVTGVAIDGDTTRLRADLGKTLLRIETVNGKSLESPVDFDFGRARDDVRKPAAGERFDYFVHEYGHFDGVVTPPKELRIRTATVANDGFHYRRYVAIHASNLVSQ